MQTEQPEPNPDSITELTSEDCNSIEVSSPGQLLMQERERRGMTEKDVSDKLHITMHYVRAIEANRYEKLPGAVFAKGYIKSYAELLGLNTDEIVTLFDGIFAEQQGAKEEISRRQQARRRSDRSKPWAYISVACFVGGFVILWAFNYYFSAASEGAPDVAETAARNMSQAPTITSQPIAQTASLSAPPEITVLPAPASQSVAILPEVAAEPQQDNLGGRAVSPDNTPPTADNLLSVLSSLAANPVTNSPTQNADPALVVATNDIQENQSSNDDTDNQFIEIDGEGDDVLRVSFTGESWIEVNDAESRQIYRDIREAGDVLEITGNAPFSILLGDAPFTRLTLNGTEIDVTGNIRIDNSARLTVGL